MWAVYSCPFERSSITAAIDVVELQPVANKPIVLMSLLLKVTSEIAEAQEEWLEYEIHRGGSAMSTGSGGSTAASGLPTTPGLPASGFQFEEGNTTVATFTGGTVPFRDAFQVRVGCELRLTPEEWIGCHNGNGGMTIRLPNAAGDSIDYKGSALIGEWI